MSSRNQTEWIVCSKCFTPKLLSSGWDLRIQICKEFTLTIKQLSILVYLFRRLKSNMLTMIFNKLAVLIEII